MPNPEDRDFNQERNRRATAYPRAVGSPLPRGTGHRTDPAGADPESRPSQPSRALGSGSSPARESDGGSGMHRAMNAIRSAVPFIQRLLPLLDGNIATAVTSVLTPPVQQSAPPVDLAPLQDSLNELQVQHSELRDQFAEQNLSIQKVEDQLQMVREATDRNTLEQQELMEDLKAVGHKANVVAIVTLGLLAISILLNVALYLHIRRVLP